MKIAALSLVYNEEPLVRGCVESLRPFVDKHIMCASLRPYFGEPSKLDNSIKIAEDLGCDVISGSWKLDHLQRNTGLDYLLEDEYDWVICSDVDMWFEHDTIKRLLEILSQDLSPAYTMSQYSYWQDTDHILEGDDFAPVVAIKPHVRFSHIGNIDSVYERLDHLKLHHLAWCAPKDIHKKVLTYPHAPEFNGQAWYDQHYLGWKDGDKAVLPNKTFNVKHQPLPDELKAYL